MPRRTPLRQTLVAPFAAVLTALIVASTAQASFIAVSPTISGSGKVTSSSTPCVAAVDTPNGGITSGCAPVSNVTASALAMVTLIATPQASPAGHWTFVRWDGDAPGCAGTTTPACVAYSPGAQYSLTAVFEDHTGPTVATPSASISTMTDRTANLTWSANETLGSASCSIDGAAFAACGSSSTSVTLAEGSHTVRVRGADRSGNVGAVSATTTFRIIDTLVVSGPAAGASSSESSPTFGFSTLTGLAFECSIDAGSFAACGTKGADGGGTRQVGPLVDGVHTFRVRARDGAEFDAVPAIRTWTVDTTAPTAIFAPGSGPGEGALQASDRETFGFSSSEAASFECRLDAAPFAACQSGLTIEGLSPGPHRFELRAVDAAGNVGAVSTRSWTTAAPDRDGDGFNSVIDCDDRNPAVRPGAVELVGNAVDENCDGIVAVGPTATAPTVVARPLPAVAKVVSTAARRSTRITSLRLAGLPSATTVVITCKGTGCPKALRGTGTTKTGLVGTVSLTKLIKGALRPGSVVTLSASAAGYVTSVTTLSVRAGKKPSVASRCLPSGSTKTQAC